MPKIIKFGRRLTNLWQKQFCTVFLRHGVKDILYIFKVLSQICVSSTTCKILPEEDRDLTNCTKLKKDTVAEVKD